MKFNNFLTICFLLHNPYNSVEIQCNKNPKYILMIRFVDSLVVLTWLQIIFHGKWNQQFQHNYRKGMMNTKEDWRRKLTIILSPLNQQTWLLETFVRISFNPVPLQCWERTCFCRQSRSREATLNRLLIRIYSLVSFLRFCKKVPLLFAKYQTWKIHFGFIQYITIWQISLIHFYKLISSLWTWMHQ